MLSRYLKVVHRVWTHPNNRRRRLTAVGRAVYGAVRSRLSAAPATRQVFGGMWLRVYPGSVYWRQLFLFGDLAEWRTACFLRDVLRTGDCFADIGANIGYMSVLAASRIGDTGWQVAVEPIPVNAARLRENVALNRLKRVDVVEAAVGPNSGTVRMCPDDVFSHITPDSVGVEVVVRKLDDLIDRPVAVCKIDVEGYELAALSGAEAAIAAGRVSVLVLEINGASRRYGVEDTEMVRFLTDRGYRLGVYRPESRFVEWDCHVWDDVIAATPAGQQFLAERLALPREIA